MNKLLLKYACYTVYTLRLDDLLLPVIATGKGILGGAVKPFSLPGLINTSELIVVVLSPSYTLLISDGLFLDDGKGLVWSRSFLRISLLETLIIVLLATLLGAITL